MKYRLGIDAGGTFTDLVAINELGKIWIAKTPSTPHRPSAAIRTGLEQLAARMDSSIHELDRKSVV